MLLQQGSAYIQQPASLESLRAQIQALQTSLSEVIAQRAGMQARLDAATGSSERVRIRNAELRPMDGQINRLQSQITGLQTELELRQTSTSNPPAAPAPAVPTPAPPPAITTVPPESGINFKDMAIGGAATLFILTPILIAITWRAGRRAVRSLRNPEGEAHSGRLNRIEESVSAIAADVERLSAGQRSLTHTLVSEQGKAPARQNRI